MRVGCLSASVVAGILKVITFHCVKLVCCDMTHVEFFQMDDYNCSSHSVGSRNIDWCVFIWEDGCACCIVQCYH